MIIMQAPNEELQKAVLEDSERLHKEAEEAFAANKKEAEEIEKYHGEDTKKAVSNKQLKAMHLSEALFEDLNSDEVKNFNEDVYDAIVRICELYAYDGVSENDVQVAIKYFLDNYKNDENIKYYLSWEKIEEPEEIPEFEGTWDKLNELTDLGESLNETLKVKMTPEEHECVNKLIRTPFYEICDILSSYELNGVEISRDALEFVFDYMLNKLRPLDESLTEELSQQGQKVLNELKKELGPELQKKVAFVIKDYAKLEKKPEQEQQEKSSEEEVE